MLAALEPQPPWPWWGLTHEVRAQEEHTLSLSLYGGGQRHLQVGAAPPEPKVPGLE